jgi:endonuclease/exonuclease/phosphatase family metal-dependent hydrolase
MQIRVATYNVHRFVGRDKQKDRTRTGRVIRQIKPDIIALQEVEYLQSPAELQPLLPEDIFQVVPGPTIVSGAEHYGNILLSRFPIKTKRNIDLSYPGREERGAIDVDIELLGKNIRLVATHLGLTPGERREQANLLLAEIDKSRTGKEITLLMGDMNEWFLWGRPLRWIHRYFGCCPDHATYPSRFPLFSLDRIWCHPPELLISRTVHKTALARVASDHLPLVGTLQL